MRMPDSSSNTDPHRTDIASLARRRSSTWAWIALGAVPVLVVGGWALIHLYTTRSPEAQLAALNATITVPDCDNAALVYAKLLTGPDSSPTLTDLAAPSSESVKQNHHAIGAGLQDLDRLLAQGTGTWTRIQSWSGQQYPAIAAWMDSHSGEIDILVQGSHRKACGLLLGRYGQEYLFVPLEFLVRSRYLSVLEIAANLDIGEDRLAQALDKAGAIVRMGRHMQQCLDPTWTLDGMPLETRGLKALGRQLLDCSHLPRGSNLGLFRDLCGPLEDQSDLVLPAVHRVLALLDDIWVQDFRREAWRSGKWRDLLSRPHADGLLDPVGESYSRYRMLLLERRLYRTLIELRAYKDRTGQWPTRLDQVQSTLPAEVVDYLRSSAPVMHCLLDGSFVLYGVDPNQEALAGLRVIHVVIHDRTRPLTAKEQEMVDRKLQAYVNLLGRDVRDREPVGVLLSCRPYSAPILIRNLQHPDRDTRSEVIHVLGRLCSTWSSMPHGFRPNSSFLSDLIAEYRKEQETLVREAYLSAMYQMDDLAEEERLLLIRFLKDVMAHEGDARLRFGASDALLNASKLEGLREIIAKWEVDPNWFGPELTTSMFPMLQEKSGMEAWSVDQFVQWWRENRDRIEADPNCLNIQPDQGASGNSGAAL